MMNGLKELKNISRNRKNIFLGIMVIAILGVVVLSASGIVQMRWEETGSETGTTVSITITGYKDGQPVTENPIYSSYMRGGVEIDSFVVVVNWVSTGTGDVVWSTFSLNGSFKVEQLIFIGGNPRYVTRAGPYIIGSTIPSSTWTKTLVLGTDVCTSATMVDDAWLLRFSGSVTGSIDELGGVTLSDTFTFPMGSVTIDFLLVGADTDYNIQGDWDY